MTPIAIRPMQRTDLAAVSTLYQQMMSEQASRYPPADPARGEKLAAWLATEFTHNLDGLVAYVAVRDAAPGPFGRPAGGEVVGFFIGEGYNRPVIAPHRVASCQLLYVAPAHRGGIGPQAVAISLMLEAMAEARRRWGTAFVLEASYVPGTHAARVWERFGFQPFHVSGALVDAEGVPQTDLPIERRREGGV